MNVLQTIKRGALGAVVVVVGLGAGMFAQETVAARGEPPPREKWSQLAREHSDSAYDSAMRRFAGNVSPAVRTAVQGLAAERTVLGVVTASDLATCEDLGRQLRELRRSVPAGPEWKMAVLVDPAGQDALQRFLRRERIAGVEVLVGDPAAFVAGAAHPGTPAAAVVDRHGVIRAGVSHPLRFRLTRSRSFAQELGLAGSPGQT